MFTLAIQVKCIADAETILASLRGDPSATPEADAMPFPSGGQVKFPARRRTTVPKELRQALTAVQVKYGLADMGKPLAILAKFGAAKLDDLAPADYPAFIAACAAA